MTPARLIGSLFPLAGLALQAWIVFGKADGGIDALIVGWLAYACLPYVASLIAIRKMTSAVPGVVGAVLGIAWDASVYHSVFVAPTSSTAAIVLVFSPAVTLVAVALGVGVTHLLQRVLAKHVPV